MSKVKFAKNGQWTLEKSDDINKKRNFLVRIGYHPDDVAGYSDAEVHEAHLKETTPKTVPGVVKPKNLPN